MNKRRILRITGTLMLGAGVLVLVWVLVVWRWQDPFTALYTTWKQHQLSQSYERRAKAFRLPEPSSKTASARVVTAGQIRAVAHRYRLESKRGQAIGRLRVPRLGLSMVVVDGTDEGSLKKGPGLDRRTYMPGEGQLIYIAGHRTTYLAPFAHIERMKAGDPITPRGSRTARSATESSSTGSSTPTTSRSCTRTGGRSSSCRPATHASSPRSATSSTRGWCRSSRVARHDPRAVPHPRRRPARVGAGLTALRQA